jgi:hypothetical protein
MQQTLPVPAMGIRYPLPLTDHSGATCSGIIKIVYADNYLDT